MPIDMNKTIAEASLDNLHDVITPEAIGFLPPAPGWYMVLLLILTLLFHTGVLWYKEYKKSRYKREALQELLKYKENTKEDMTALLSLAKRVGIAAYGRAKVGNLSDKSWWDFMQNNSKLKVPKSLREEVSKLLYQKHYVLNETLYDEIRTSVTLWLKTHKVQK